METAAIWSEVLNYAPKLLEFQRQHQRMPGFQVAVAVDGKLLGSFSGGFADVAAETLMTDETLFRVASHSKTFTGTAIMQLSEQGKVRLDDPIEQHVPELAGSEMAGVTVAELLSHSSGITRDGDDSDFWILSRKFPSRDELIEMAKTGKRNEPGAHLKYSNVGYSLLGLVIEEASGQDYAAYVTENIVNRLGLRNTGPELDPAREPELARGYSALTYAPERSTIDHIDTHSMAAATGFYSTAADLVTYFSAHLPGDDTLLTDRSKRRMQHPVWAASGANHGYGLGLMLAEVQGKQVFGHGGGYPGHITRTWVEPESRVCVSVLTNSLDGPANTWVNELFALASIIAREPTSAAPEGTDLSRFTGRFASLWGVGDVVELGGKLVEMSPAALGVDVEGLTELEYVDDSTLRSLEPTGFGGRGETMHYEFDDDGASAIRGPGGMLQRRHADFRIEERVSIPV